MSGVDDRAAHFGQRAAAAFDVLAVAIHVRAVLEANRVEVARIRIDVVRRGFDGDRLSDRKLFLVPARASQHVDRSHLAAVVRHLAVRFR